MKASIIDFQDMEMSVLLSLFLATLMSLQLLSSLSTCRPIVNNVLETSNIIINSHGNIAKDNLKHSSYDNMENNYMRRKALVPGLFVFGDSTVDAGNNNHLVTISRSNFVPYGRDFPEGKATGRFCNGKLVTDYIGSLMGLQDTTVAYLDIKSPKARGKGGTLPLEVSFASASSGFYESTARHFNALSLMKQLKQFKDYRQEIVGELGRDNTTKVLSKAIFIISTGTNDYLNNYFVNPYLRAKYTLPQFQKILLHICAHFIKDLYDLGARRIGVVSLPPFGCLPAIRTLYMQGEGYNCVEHLNYHAISFNKDLTNSIFNALREDLPDVHLAYMDSYSVLLDVVNNPISYGLKKSHKACCGSGKLEVGIFCNALSMGTCNDATSYVFWDSFHPTDRANQILATKIMQQSWREFDIHEPFPHLSTHASNKVSHHPQKHGLVTKRWRWRFFFLGGFFYAIHIIKQVFPKMIDVGI